MTNIRTGVVYLATHPSLEGIYIGASYTSLEVYNTSSTLIRSLVDLTGIRPTFEILETHEVDFSQEDDSNRQIIFKREREIYDEMLANGFEFPHQERPHGVCGGVNRDFQDSNTWLMTSESKAKIGEKNKGKNSNDGFRAIMKKANAGKRIKPANIYCYKTHELLFENVILTSWCKERGINKSCMSRTARGQNNHHRFMYARYIEDLALKS